VNPDALDIWTSLSSVLNSMQNCLPPALPGSFDSKTKTSFFAKASSQLEWAGNWPSHWDPRWKIITIIGCASLVKRANYFCFGRWCASLFACRSYNMPASGLLHSDSAARPCTELSGPPPLPSAATLEQPGQSHELGRILIHWFHLQSSPCSGWLQLCHAPLLSSQTPAPTVYAHGN
jgi:hypothetical protein